ncbi:MAG: hypothetical protein E6R03_07105 [Hyphomicrobiaceae bacterium]|nr:MAG: hypothetical protein E6R03_07105 [Hyphomicrobiaceae bacterium]
MGVERFAGIDFSLASLGTKPLTTSAKFASRNLFRAGAARSLTNAVVAEGVMAATLNQNEFLYSDSFSHNVAWSAAGLGMVAGLEGMVTTYTLRKIASSDVVRRMNARSFDVTGLESQRLNSTSIVNDLLRASNEGFKDKPWLFASSGATTDKITSLALSASELQKPRGVTEKATSLFRKREAIGTPQFKMADEELNKVTVRGLTGVSNAGFGTHMKGLGNPLRASLRADGTFLYGIEELGTEVENLGRVGTVALRDKGLSKRFSQVQQLLADGGKMERTRYRTKQGEVFADELVPLSDDARKALVDEMHEIRFKSSQVPVTMLEMGEWAPIEMGKLADNYVPRPVAEEGGLGEGNLKIWMREKAGKAEETLGISSNGDLYLPANGRLESLKIEDMLHLYHVGNKAVRDMKAAGHRLILPPKPNWFQLDMAEQLIKATDDPTMVSFPGAMTRQSAQVESLAQKVSSLRRRENAVKLANKRGMAESIDEIKAFEHRVFFNLPRLTSYQQGLMGVSETPLDFLLAGLKTGDEVRAMAHDELLKAINDSKKITGFTEETRDTLDELQGNSFNFLLDYDGNPIKPIIGFKRPMSPSDWTRDELFVRQTMKAAHVRETLTGPGADPLTREAVTYLMQNPNFAEARKVMELADDQHRSFVPGFRESAPQSTGGSFMNAITSRDRRDVDILVMRAASSVQEEMTRIINTQMRELVTNTMEGTITLVNSPRNVQSKMLLDQFHTFRPGWELARDAKKIQLPNGKAGYQFVLDHESINNQRWFKEAHGREFTKGQPLLSPNGTEIVLDELGYATLTRLQEIHKAEIAMKNTLLRSQGLSELKEVPWYAPPPNNRGKFVAYVFDSRNNIIPGRTVTSETADGLTKEIAAIQSNLKPGETVRTRQEIESFMSIWDKAQMNFVAPNTTAIQPGKHNYGKSGGALMNPNAFDEALVTVRDNLANHGNDLLEIIYEDPLKAARARASVARMQSGVGEKAVQHSSIYDRYQQNLLGRNALGAKDSYFGDLYGFAEARLNAMLAGNRVSLKIGEVYQGLTDFLRVSSPTNPVQGEKFNKLAQALGKYMPYESAAEMAARQTGTKPPAEVAEIAGKLSWFEAASRLRWMESMHAVATVGSLLANTPSVIKALQPMAGETLEAAAKRNSSMAMMAATSDGQGLGIVHTYKLLWNAMKLAGSKELDEFGKRGIRLGYMDQDVAEFQRAWGAIDSRDGWRKFVFGDGLTKTRGKLFSKERATTSFKRGGLDSWLSILSDKSEAFTRQWGMYTGKLVAESMGIHAVDDQLAFAHDLTNKIIANYDPKNRPEIFQGALGASLGLFQTYSWSFYNRMFRYMETKNASAIATQYAMQSAVFGIQSVPGWDALNWAFFDRGQTDNEDPVESMYKRFGTFDADLIMHGTISNLPKIFGADGMNLYTRGDAQFRTPVNPVGAVTDFLGLTQGGNGGQFPLADSLKRLVKGTIEGVRQIQVANGISANHAAEILSNMVTNRPLAGMLEVAGANGFDTSWDGQVVSQAKTTAEKTFRILGVRSMRQQTEIDAFFANKNSREEQTARKVALNSATRSAMRDGRYEDVPGLWKKYVENGGDPKTYTRWVKSAFQSAIDSRGERMLTQALKDEDGSKNAMIGRLLDSQIDITTDDTASDDYGREEALKQMIDESWDDGPPETTDEPQ